MYNVQKVGVANQLQDWFSDIQMIVTLNKAQ
jgi:hypothetical protein